MLTRRHSFSPGGEYQAFACYDLLDDGRQTLSEYGVWSRNTGVQAGKASLDVPYGYNNTGAIFSFDGTPAQVNIRVGVSFRSTAQACANLETEIGGASFDAIRGAAKALWNDKLSRIELDVANTPADVTELFYSSLYRSNLTPVRPSH